MESRMIALLCLVGMVFVLILIGLLVDWGIAALALVACGLTLGTCVFYDDHLYQKAVGKR